MGQRAWLKRLHLALWERRTLNSAAAHQAASPSETAVPLPSPSEERAGGVGPAAPPTAGTELSAADRRFAEEQDSWPAIPDHVCKAITALLICYNDIANLPRTLAALR